jgi:hypothetical protein
MKGSSRVNHENPPLLPFIKGGVGGIWKLFSTQSQWPMTKTIFLSNLRFGHWSLFVIWCLLFGTWSRASRDWCFS